MNVLLEFIMFPEKLVGRSQFESTPHNPTSPFFFQLCFLRIGKNMWWLTKANFITHQNLRANHYPPSAWGSEPEPSLQKKNPRKTKHLKTPSFRELRAGTTRKPPPKPKAPPRPPATKPMPRDPALRRPSWRWRNQPSSGKWDAEAKKMKRASFHFTMMMQGTQQTKELNLRPGTFPTQPNCPTKKKKPPPPRPVVTVGPVATVGSAHLWTLPTFLPQESGFGRCSTVRFTVGVCQVRPGWRMATAKATKTWGSFLGGVFFLRWQNHQKMRRYDISPDICRVLLNAYDF